MEILNNIQKKLKAPKGQHNSFGNYDYRSCEDILEAVKPLLGEAILTLTDDVVLIGDRFYVKAFATIKHKEESVTVTALARESSEKKGMDTAQITGAASSYARKYALNGLFLIDDTKDADTEEPKNTTIHHAISEKTTTQGTEIHYEQKPINAISDKQDKRLFAIRRESGIPDDLFQDWLVEKFGVDKTSLIQRDWYEEICTYAQNYNK